MTEIAERKKELALPVICMVMRGWRPPIHRTDKIHGRPDALIREVVRRTA